MSGIILTLNSGSSSLKFAVFDDARAPGAPLIRGKVAGIGAAPVFSARGADRAPLAPGASFSLDAASDHAAVIAKLLPWLSDQSQGRPLRSVGHRVVHGGPEFTGPTLVTPSVLGELERLEPLAPLHQPHNVAAIRAVERWAPGVPQVACFDTSFHRGLDRLAQLFALPRELTDQGLIRYGFHGLSYDHIAGVLPDHLGDLAAGRVIVAHLGNGASMCAMQDRKSVATTMGFTALDGLMMGRRCGSLDPGVVLYLMREKGMTASEIETLLYRRSGLLGVSGISNDMQVLQASGDPHAKEAIALYCNRAAAALAGLVPSLGGLDAMVFTAGIGENSAPVRREICQRLAWLGVVLDDTANDENRSVISAASSGTKVLVIPTNEEAVVANGCRSVLS